MDTDPLTNPSLNRTRLIALTAGLCVTAAAFVVYALTAFRSISWWDNPECVAAIATLGIPHTPGSLLLVLTGWVVSKLSFGISTVFALNLFAGLMAAVTGALVSHIAIRLMGTPQGQTLPTSRWPTTPFVIGAAAGALLFSFGQTHWFYATRITPYIMTALFTALIFLAMTRWWLHADDRGAHKWLLTTALLIGLDFSIHRTNLLLLPGLAVWVLLRRPRTILCVKSWLSGIIGIAGGAVFHLLLIPMALREPFINMGNPNNLSRFWEYVSLEQYGGGWLMNIFPRQAAFWGYQTADYVRAFQDNFFSLDGTLGFLGFLPLLLGVIGAVGLWRHNRRMALGLVALFLITAIATIVYFNLPESFFRSIDRHYMPSFVIWAVMMAIGAGYVFRLAVRTRRRWRLPAVALTAIVLLLAIGAQLTRNYRNIDSSNNFLAYDYADNVLRYMAPNAIVFTNADIDTFPMLYLQTVEGVRPDVTICNLSLLNTPWYPASIQANDDRFPLSLTKTELENLTPVYRGPRIIALPVDDQPGSSPLPPRAVIPDTLYTQIPPDSAEFVFVAEQLLTRLLAENQWRRPVYISGFAGPRWLAPWERNLRLEGAVYQLMPIDSVEVDTDLLRKNLTERYVYRGYDDPLVPIERPTKWTASMYWSAFEHLIEALETRDDGTCEEVVRYLVETLPSDRLEIAQDRQEQVETACGR
ncbi:MAG: DUF2723 domain-containing protein [Candidatus Latescibacterota bacterium]|nr:MAG: DUF2723 domain-containing protein [Candidatus Latescibacterota bacterium]